jgi:glycosyltransferase involved in cell wall biosynthesis
MNTPTRPAVLHIMRTYGAHGGENQLASYLSAARPDQDLSEEFAFVFRDPACRALFAERGVRTPLHDLYTRPRATAGAWREVTGVLMRLPVLQWRLARLLARLDPSVCVVHGVQAALVAWPFALLRARRRRRFVYVHRIAKVSGKTGLTKLLYRPFDLLAGNSEAVARSLDGLSDQAPIVALENGVDLERLAARAAADPQPATPTRGADLIAVGRLLPHKNQRLVIEATAIALRARPTIVTWIVGDGPERADLEKRARDLGVNEHVHFLGQRADVPALLARARVFANASLWEGMSNAVLEAMAMRLPSVVVDAPGVSECHEPDVTGIVVPPDADAFAAAILRYLDDAAAALACGARARDRIERHYSIAASRTRYLNLFRHLIAGKS